MSSNSLKVALVLSLAFNVAVIGTVVYGFARGSTPGEGQLPAPGAEALGGRCMHLCKGIGVPQERVVRFSHTMASSSGEMRETRLRLQRTRAELIELLRAPQPDEKAIMAKVEEISALQGDLEKGLVRRLLKASSVLSPEERGRLMRLIGNRCMPCGKLDRQGLGAPGPAAEGVPQQQEVGE